jgi:hypothetical protein
VSDSAVTQEKVAQKTVEEAILDAIRSLKYGSVEITVHESRVVQIECKSKIRL